MDTLRKAFLETFRDKEFLAETGKAKMDVGPVAREDLEKSVVGLSKLESAFLPKLKEIVYK